LVASLAFVPILLWGQFLFPIGDDLESANWPGGWHALYQVPFTLWHTWSGCYSASFFRVLHAPLTRAGVFWTTPLFFLILHGIFGAVALRLCRRVRRIKTFIIALIWALAYFATMPAPAETVFWATGMLVYEPGNILALFLTIVASGSQREGRQKSLQTVLLWTLTPLIAGCHFVFALWAIAILGLRTWENGGKRADVILLIWCLFFAGLVIGAPGNFQRYVFRMSDAPITFGYVVTRSIGSFVEFLIRELSLVQNWLWVTFGTIFVSRHVVKENNRSTLVGVIVRVLAVLLPIFGIFVLSTMTREVPPPARTLNALHYLLMLGVIVVVAPVVLKLSWVSARLHRWLDDSHVFRKAAAATLCFAVLSPNYVRCVRELVTVAPQYKQYWYEVERRVAEAKEKGLPRVEIPSDPERRPVTVFHPSFLGPDPEAWPNRDYAKFFGIAQIVAVETK